MLFIIATMYDGTRTMLAYTKDVNLDIQAWIDSRRKAFRILNIVHIEYVKVEC